jgi:uncharacterized protein (TIGR00297 family)
MTSVFALFGWMVGGVSPSGALAGGVCAFSLYYFAGPGAFIVLLWVFVITWLTTRFGDARKRQLGLAENARGRSATQVSANLAVAAACSVLSALLHRPLLLAAAMAALAEAAGDTSSSECGLALSDRAYLITTARPVAVGTDGAVSWPGTLAAALAGTVVAAVAAATNVLPLGALPLVAAAGFAGTLLDSVLGATWQRRGLLSNSGVNLLATVFAALCAGVWLAW